MKLLCGLIFALISTCPPGSCQTQDSSAGLDRMGLYEETGARGLKDPDSIANLGLFHGLSKIHVYDSVHAKEPKVDSTMLERKLRNMGVTCVGSQLALATDSTWIDFTTRPNHPEGTLNCILTVSDVIKLERKPLKKYRLTWWYKRVEAVTIQEGFDKLSELLIADLSKANKLKADGK
ncbi:MAG: hypothetical protein WC028_26360 [Candidatus Obscuribacterales bacterium]